MWNVTLHGEVFHYGTGIARACHPAPDLLDCFGCRSQIDQSGGTSVLRFDNVIWN